MIKKMAKKHVKSVAEIHADALQGDFLSILGPKFLQVIYTGMCETKGNFGFVKLDKSRVVGFITGSDDTGKLFKRLIRKRWFRLSTAALPAIMKNPLRLKNVFETFFYTDKAESETEKAELVSIAVLPNQRGKKVGSKLLSALVEQFKRQGVTRFKVTVNRSNKGANRFYQKTGFQYKRKFKIYNKYMNLYSYRIGK